MKLLDDKGKLFGIVNVVDLIVVLIIVGLIGGVSYRLVSKKVNAREETPLAQKEEIYVTLFSSLVIPEIGEGLKVGDKLVANNKFTNAEIVDIKVEQANSVNPDANGKATLSKHPLWKDVTVVIKDTVNPSNVVLKAGEQEVRVGYSFILKTQTVETNCRIRGVEFKKIQ